MTVAPALSLRERFASRDVSQSTTRRILLPVWLGATAVAFMIPLLLPPEAMLRPNPLTVDALVGLLAVSVVAGLIAMSWVWAEASIARLAGRTDLQVFVIFYAVGGAVVGLVLVSLLPIVGFEWRAPAVVPVLSMATMAAWSAVLLGSVRDGRQRLRITRMAMVEQATAIAMTSESQSAFIEDLRRQLSAEVEGSLRPTFERTAERLDFEAHFAQDRVATAAVQALTELTEASVRPFSRVLNRRAKNHGDRRGPLAFIQGVARRQPFRPVSVTVIFVVTSMAEVWAGPNPVPALAATALGVGLIFAILGAGNSLMRRWPRWHARIFVSTFIVLQVPSVWWIARTASLLDFQVLAELAIMILLSACIVWLTSGIGLWRASESEWLAIYAEDLDSARIDVLVQGEIMRSITKDAARVLHGSVQSRLTACILALDRAAQADDLQAQVQAISQAREILNDSWSVPTPKVREASIDVLVRDKVALWQGLAGITAFVDPSLRDYRGPAAFRVADIVEESLCNAVRHGEAPSVSVHVESVVEGDRNYIRVRAVDDGSGPGKWTAGLGTVYFDEACQGRWSLGVSTTGGGLLDAWVVVEPEQT
jgi:signal transduction histidine kinase